MSWRCRLWSHFWTEKIYIGPSGAEIRDGIVHGAPIVVNRGGQSHQFLSSSASKTVGQGSVLDEVINHSWKLV